MKKLFKRFSAGPTMFIESVRMSVSNICHNRMRSFLTILGIMIGVTAVIALIRRPRRYRPPFRTPSPPWVRGR